MRIAPIIIGLLIIGTVITGFYAITNDMTDSTQGYSSPELDDSYKYNFSKTEETSSKIQGSWDNMTDPQGGLFAGSATAQYFLLPFRAIVLIKNIVTYPIQLGDEMISATVGFLQLPQWIETLISTLLILILFFGLIAMILRYKYV